MIPLRKGPLQTGKAYILLEQFEEARESLLCASRLKPNDAEIKKEMQRLEELMLKRKQKEAEAAYCHNMFKDYEKIEKDLDTGGSGLSPLHPAPGVQG